LDAAISDTGLLSVGSDVPVSTVLTVRATSARNNDIYNEATVTIIATVPTSLTVTPPTAHVIQGNDQSFSVTPYPTGSDAGVTWSVTGHLDAAISDTGLLSVGSDVPVSTVLTVRATSTRNSAIYSEAIVTVLAPIPTSLTVAPPTAYVIQGNDQSFSVTPYPTGSDAGVTWSVAGHLNATINDTGLLTVGSGVPVSTILTIRATSTRSSNVYDEATVTVIATVPTSLTVTPSAAYVIQGNNQPFNVIPYPANSDASVTWSVTGHLDAAINEAGLLTVGSNVPVNTVLTIKATSTRNTGIYNKSIITVLAPVPTSLTVIPSTANIQPGNTQQFSTIASPANSNNSVTWSLGASTPPGVSINPSTGVLTVPNNVTAGTIITVRATSTISSHIFSEATAIITSSNASEGSNNIAVPPPPPRPRPQYVSSNNVTHNGEHAANNNIAPAASPLSPPPAPTLLHNILIFTDGNNRYSLNARSSEAAGKPFIEPATGRMMIPLRSVSEALGVDVEWDSANRAAIIYLPTGTLVLPINKMLPNNMGMPLIVGSRVFVPARFVMYAFNAHVEWDSANRAAIITWYS